jgi:hypothetical protein
MLEVQRDWNSGEAGSAGIKPRIAATTQIDFDHTTRQIRRVSRLFGGTFLAKRFPGDFSKKPGGCGRCGVMAGTFSSSPHKGYFFPVRRQGTRTTRQSRGFS